MTNKQYREMDWLAIILLAIAALIICLTNVACSTFFVDDEVTYYVAGTTTADGSHYNPEQLTCAVKDRTLLHHWIRFEYRGNVVYCWANDVMPKTAKADYDLTPAAFMRLAPLYKGRLKVNAEIAP